MHFIECMRKKWRKLSWQYEHICCYTIKKYIYVEILCNLDISAMSISFFLQKGSIANLLLWEGVLGDPGTGGGILAVCLPSWILFLLHSGHHMSSFPPLRPFHYTASAWSWPDMQILSLLKISTKIKLSSLNCRCWIFCPSDQNYLSEKKYFKMQQWETWVDFV